MELMTVTQAEAERAKLDLFRRRDSFGYPNFKVLLDADFVQLMAQDRRVIDNIKILFGADVEIFVTKCVKIEAGVNVEIGKKKAGLRLDPSIKDHTCVHTRSPREGITCVNQLLGKYNHGKFILATCNMERGKGRQIWVNSLPVLLGVQNGGLSIMDLSTTQSLYFAKAMEPDEIAERKKDRKQWKATVKRETERDAQLLKDAMKRHQKEATESNKAKRLKRDAESSWK